MCSESLFCFLQGRMFKNTNILAKHYTTHSALSAVVVLHSPSFCLSTRAAESAHVLEITKLCCLSPGCFVLFLSSGQRTITVNAFWLYVMQGWCRSKKKNPLQWYSTHFYSWILRPNFYSLSSICSFIKHHKLELSFTGKQDDLISTGLSPVHQIMFPLSVSRSAELWLSSQLRNIRSLMQLTSCIFFLPFSFFLQGRKRGKFF